MKERILRRDYKSQKQSSQTKQNEENTVYIKEVLHAKPERLSGESLVHTKAGERDVN